MVDSDNLKVALTRLAEGLEMAFKNKKSTSRTPFRFGAWGLGKWMNNSEMNSGECHSLR